MRLMWIAKDCKRRAVAGFEMRADELIETGSIGPNLRHRQLSPTFLAY